MRKVEEKVQEGVRKIKRMYTGQQRYISVKISVGDDTLGLAHISDALRSLYVHILANDKQYYCSSYIHIR